MAEAELGQNVLPHALGSGGGQGDNRSVGTDLAERLQPAVGGAELVAPLGDAVGFVDGDEADVEAGEKALELGQGGAFRGNVEDFDAAVPNTLLDQGNLGRGEGAVDETGGNAVGSEGVDLVFHQGDEWGDHESKAVEGQGGQLVTEGLAAAGGQEDKAVSAGHDGGDDLFLAGQEGVVPEVGFQEVKHRNTLPENCGSYNGRLSWGGPPMGRRPGCWGLGTGVVGRGHLRRGWAYLAPGGVWCDRPLALRRGSGRTDWVWTGGCFGGAHHERGWAYLAPGVFRAYLKNK